ncbi:unnamed protein product [Linum tenue]|uniref:Uncharacterized protein n=1 Tax=Linum tenue TaxID=586396 RepID=A0AAV0HDW2_9ROSI|nr:unnamed protein product [Linum tenue]
MASSQISMHPLNPTTFYCHPMQREIPAVLDFLGKSPFHVSFFFYMSNPMHKQQATRNCRTSQLISY